MGSELVSICVVSPSGPLDEAALRRGWAVLDRLRTQVSALHCPDFDVESEPNLPVTPVTKLIVLVAYELGSDWIEAIDKILELCSAPEQLLRPLQGDASLGRRTWGKAEIYYAGAMTWGDEPGEEAYQALKWLMILGVGQEMGLE